MRPLPRSTLFPYTTLFRSARILAAASLADRAHQAVRRRHGADVDLRTDRRRRDADDCRTVVGADAEGRRAAARIPGRSEEHTSELQSLRHLVCRLLLEKKN